jgi:hypothetical protein
MEIRAQAGQLVAPALGQSLRRKFAILWMGLHGAAASIGCTARQTFAHLQEANLATHDDLQCHAYVVWNNEPVTDVVLSLPGTGTGTSAFLPDYADAVLASRPAAYLTFDKPGVHAIFGDPSSVSIDDAPFARHTQGTLLECAASALRLSRDRFGSGIRWHFLGHSEGASIELYLVDALLSGQPADAASVKSLVFSGLPLEPLDDNLRRQLADKPKLAQAVEACDWPVMRQQLGASCAYFADARTRPSGFTLFERLAAAPYRGPIRVFQGNDDVNTLASFTRQLEAWNGSQGHLDLTVRYYDAGHGGTPEVRRELADLLVSLVPAAAP